MKTTTASSAEEMAAVEWFHVFLRLVSLSHFVQVQFVGNVAALNTGLPAGHLNGGNVSSLFS